MHPRSAAQCVNAARKVCISIQMRLDCRSVRMRGLAKADQPTQLTVTLRRPLRDLGCEESHSPEQVESCDARHPEYLHEHACSDRSQLPT
eukprot:10213875-Alexandrium_andersonii.AAC.1